MKVFAHFFCVKALLSAIYFTIRIVFVQNLFFLDTVRSN
jgi:hypothetical protein